MTSETVRQAAIRYVSAAGNAQPERTDRVSRASRVLGRWQIHLAKRAKRIVWNLYAHKNNSGIWDRLIMPDSLGQLTAAAPTGNGWYAVKWPVNPHFTGESGLLEMLNETKSTV